MKTRREKPYAYVRLPQLRFHPYTYTDFHNLPAMSDDEELAIYDEVEIEDMTYDAARGLYHHPCPCGDRFEISLDELLDGSNDIAVCPSCSLMIRVIYEVVSIHGRQSASLCGDCN